jgi:glycosyltransferase involved in cell wall biosynthesis
MIINIITVVFNDAKHIEETIKSVIQQQQKRPDLKIDYFVIDGGSTDGTLEVLKKYNSDIYKWISEADRGIYDAMNKGLNLVTDGYVLYLGAGDKILNLPTLQLLMSDVKAICGDAIVNGNSVFKSNTDKGLRFGNSLHHQALLIHRAIFPAQAFDTKYKAYADYDLNIRLLQSGVDFVYSSDLSAYQMSGGFTETTYMSEMVDIVRSNFGLVSATFLTLRFFLAHAKKILTNGKTNLTWKRS